MNPSRILPVFVVFVANGVFGLVAQAYGSQDSESLLRMATEAVKVWELDNSPVRGQFFSGLGIGVNSGKSIATVYEVKDRSNTQAARFSCEHTDSKTKCLPEALDPLARPSLPGDLTPESFKSNAYIDALKSGVRFALRNGATTSQVAGLKSWLSLEEEHGDAEAVIRIVVSTPAAVKAEYRYACHFHGASITCHAESDRGEFEPDALEPSSN
jgi:hypothetical protein